MHFKRVATLPCEMHYSLLLHWQWYVQCSTERPAGASSVHRHFEHATGRYAIDATDSVCHQTKVGSIHSGDIDSGDACTRNQTVLRAKCRRMLFCQKKNNFPGNWRAVHASVLALKDNTLSKFCDSVNNWLNLSQTLTWQDFIVISAQCVLFLNVCIHKVV